MAERRGEAFEEDRRTARKLFIALILAGDLLGLLGLVLAIPVLAVIKVLIRFLDELYLR